MNIFGLVASTGPGHEPPFANLCNVESAGQARSFRRLRRDLGGHDAVVIDSTGAHNGEVNADTARRAAPRAGSWIDLLANGAITIRGIRRRRRRRATMTPIPPFAVHANQILQNGHGGDVTVISTAAPVTTFGRAVQANASTGSDGGTGGHIAVLAAPAKWPLAPGLSAAFIQAAGDTSAGGSRPGGTIVAQSFNGNVTGIAASQLNVDGPAARPSAP